MCTSARVHTHSHSTTSKDQSPDGPSKLDGKSQGEGQKLGEIIRPRNVQRRSRRPEIWFSVVVIVSLKAPSI